MRKYLSLLTLVLLALMALALPASAQEAAVGETITVDGIVAEIVSPNAFLLDADSFGDEGFDDVLVFPGLDEDFTIDINVGRRVQVTGELTVFDPVDIETQLGFDLDETEFTEFNESDFAILATVVTPLTPLDVVDTELVEGIQADPTAYLGQEVTVNGVARIVGPNAFEITNTGPFSLEPASLLVFPGVDDEFLIDINNGLVVQVTGELVAFDPVDLEARLGLEIDETEFAAFDDSDFALIADTVLPLRAGDLLVPEFAERIEADPTAFLGQMIIVDGIANILGPNAFELIDTEPFSLDPASIIVFPGPDGEFLADINEGLPVQVTGLLLPFDTAMIESQFGLEVDETALTDFDDSDFALLAVATVPLAEPGVVAEPDVVDDEAALEDDALDDETALEDEALGEPLLIDDDPFATLDTITDEPIEYYGELVQVAGEVNEVIALGGGFIIEEDDLIGDDHALVLPGEADLFVDAVWAVEDVVVVTGVVRPLVIEDLEAELGFDLDDELYAGYEGMPAVIALDVAPAVE